MQNSTSTYVPATIGHHHDGTDKFEQPHNLAQPETDAVLQNIVVYISGFVVRKTVTKPACITCKSSLVTETSDSPSYFFLKFKSHGGLVLPAKGVVDVNLFVESYLRQMSDIHKVSRQVNSANFQSAVVQEFKEKDIFHLEDHIHETQDCDNNHHIDMIKLVCQTYYDLRQHHICRLHNASLHSKQL